MARHLASIYATEKDRVNCPFYLKIGACRHGDRCSRLHTRPAISQTILVSNMYQNPVLTQPIGEDGLPMPIDPQKKLDDFEDFFEDVFAEMAKFGEVEEMQVVDNLNDHLVGNVYVKYKREEDAAKALQGLTGRFYWGRALQVEFSPVLDFRQATCRQYEEQVCNYGGHCNYLHMMPMTRELAKRTYGRQRKRIAAALHDDPELKRAKELEEQKLRETEELAQKVRSGSEERRAMFAAWNAAGGAAAAQGGSLPPPPQ